jgi:hypothetical protein
LLPPNDDDDDDDDRNASPLRVALPRLGHLS